MSHGSSNEERFRSLVEATPDTVILHAGGKLLFINPAGVRLLAASSPEELIGRPMKDFVQAGNRSIVLDRVNPPFTGPSKLTEDLMVRLDSEVIEVEVVGLPSSYENRPATQLVIRDITQRKRAEAALRASEQRYRSLFEGVPVGVYRISRRGELELLNGAMAELLGNRHRDALIGLDTGELYTNPDDRTVWKAIMQYEGRVTNFETQIQRLDGSKIWVRSHAQALHDEHGEVTGYEATVEDISDRKRVEEQLLHDALHDSLTKLPNRTLLMDRLSHCLARRVRFADYRCAVLFLDLDRFKMVNDSFGHAVGDHLLIQASHRLADCLRPNDTLARLGGDEFAILLDDVKDASNAVRVAQRIQQELEVPFQLEGREVYSSASIGIALSDGESRPEDVVRDADTAMYRSKSQGRAGYAIFDSRMHAEVSTQLQLETDLRRALASWQFEVFYQPIVALSSGNLAGFEALVRWRHPEHGLVLPGEFMPMAEETGLINPIGHGVMLEACRQMKVWNDRRAPREPVFISVNLSTRQFRQPDLFDQLSQLLDSSGLSGDRLTIEITEGAVMNEPDAVLQTLARIKRLGIRISLDDFGTGYSSLSVLHRLPFDRIKIDRWFVQHIGVDNGSDELVEGIVALCRGRRLDIIAEGVETNEQRQKLADLGCGFAQGFLFSEPISQEHAGRLLATPSPNFESM